MSAIHEFAHITTFDDHTDRIIQNYKDAESILQETYELQQGTLDLYSNHLKKHFNNIGEGEAWIAKGVDLANNLTSSAKYSSGLVVSGSLSFCKLSIISIFISPVSLGNT